MLESLMEMMRALGPIGIAVLMFLENIIPMIPSEVIMPAAGGSARTGDANLFLIILAGSIGSLAGTYAWYAIARYVGTERFRSWVDRHSHWVGTTPKEVDKMDRWFNRYGHWAVFFGRLIPGVRTLISVPAGFAEMPRRSFLIYTAMGTLLWTMILAGLGYWLRGKSETVADIVSWIGVIVVVTLTILFVGRVIRVHLQRGKNEQAGASNSYSN